MRVRDGSVQQTPGRVVSITGKKQFSFGKERVIVIDRITGSLFEKDQVISIFSNGERRIDACRGRTDFVLTAEECSVGDRIRLNISSENSQILSIQNLLRNYIHRIGQPQAFT